MSFDWEALEKEDLSEPLDRLRGGNGGAVGFGFWLTLEGEEVNDTAIQTI